MARRCSAAEASSSSIAFTCPSSPMADCRKTERDRENRIWRERRKVSGSREYRSGCLKMACGCREWTRGEKWSASLAPYLSLKKDRDMTTGAKQRYPRGWDSKGLQPLHSRQLFLFFHLNEFFNIILLP